MTRQQRITLEQVRAKKNEALGRMNDVLKKIGESRENRIPDALFDELSHARRDFDAWNTVFSSLAEPGTVAWVEPEERRTIVSVGDPYDGIQIVGPFESVHEARVWAEVHVRHSTWNILQLADPESEEWV